MISPNGVDVRVALATTNIGAGGACSAAGPNSSESGETAGGGNGGGRVFRNAAAKPLMLAGCAGAAA